MSRVAGFWRWICLFIVCLISAAPHSAQDDSAEILWYGSDDEGFIAHIRLADDLRIQTAELETSAETIPLTSQNLNIEQWIILDASAAAVNAAPAIQAALLDYVRTPVSDLGLIGFAGEINSLAPSRNGSELQTWLRNYRAFSDESGCLGTALEWLNSQARQRNRARQALAIVGQYQNCDYPQIDYPLDIIVVGADPSPYGETARVASLQTLGTRLASSAAQWSQPLIAVLGANPTVEEGNLKLSLSNGENLSLPIELDLAAAVPTALPSASPSPEATATEEASAIPTNNPTALPVSATSIPNTVAAPTENPVSTTKPTPLLLSNNLLIIGGGVAAVLVVIAVMLLLLRGSRRGKHYNEAAIDNTLMYQYQNEGELDQTEIVSMRQMLAQVGPTLVGRLQDEDGQIYEIHRPVTTLGRREDSDIRIDNDKQISREHLRFSVREDGSIWLTRLSQNPVLLNDVAVETSLQVKSGDILQLSPHLRLTLEVVTNE